MKLKRVHYVDGKLEKHHPLHELELAIKTNTDPYDYDSVHDFFNSMIVPPGYYAILALDEWGAFIEFYEPMN